MKRLIFWVRTMNPWAKVFIVVALLATIWIFGYGTFIRVVHKGDNEKLKKLVLGPTPTITSIPIYGTVYPTPYIKEPGYIKNVQYGVPFEIPREEGKTSKYTISWDYPSNVRDDREMYMGEPIVIIVTIHDSSWDPGKNTVIVTDLLWEDFENVNTPINGRRANGMFHVTHVQESAIIIDIAYGYYWFNNE